MTLCALALWHLWLLLLLLLLVLLLVLLGVPLWLLWQQWGCSTPPCGLPHTLLPLLPLLPWLLLEGKHRVGDDCGGGGQEPPTPSTCAPGPR